MLQPRVTNRPSRPLLSVRGWAAGGVLLLIAAFGGGFLASQATQPAPADLAPAWVVHLVDDHFLAMNTGSAAGLEATMTDDSVLSDMKTGVQAFGSSQVIEVLLADGDRAVRRTSDVVYEDGFATFTFRFGDEPASVPAVGTFRIADGKIAHLWVMSDEPGGFV